VFTNQSNAALENECNREVCLASSIQARSEMRKQWIVRSSNEQTLRGWSFQQIESCQPGLQIVSSAGDNVTHTATRVRHVSIESRDQVHMQVGNCLAGSFPDVDSDVEPVRGMLLKNDLTTAIESAEHGALFLFGGLEPIRDMSRCDDQQMPAGNRILVPDGKHQIVAEHHL
jgi:hypothetical protein